MSKLRTTCFVLCLLLCASCRQSLSQTPDVVDTIRSRSLFFETFDTDEWQSRWSHSRDTKYNGRFTTEAAKGWTNKGLKMPEKNKYYGLTALLDMPVDPVVASSPFPLPLVVQYEMKYDAGVTCGGSYIKLLTANPNFKAEDLVDSTPYSIMFGPDRCGGTSKVHLILRHRNPVNGTVTEKHLASPPAPETNEHTHVYTLKLFPDHKYEVLIDGEVKSSGSLLDLSTLRPPLLPPRELPDPEDKKPADWVDIAEIPDPDAVKPDDWDDREMIEDEKAVKPKGWLESEPALIANPAAKRPPEWDDEEDGVWEPNQIPNPRCKAGCGPWKRPLKRNPAWKGAWKPPSIKNPAYKGPWVQKTIPNPEFYEEAEPLRSGVGPIGAVALELWTIDSGYMYDNFLITRDLAVAELVLEKLWKPRHDAEVAAVEAQLKEKEREDKERQKKDAEKKKERRKSRKSGEKIREITYTILALFEEGSMLAPLAPFLGPVLNYLRANPDTIILVVGLGPILLLTILMLVRVKGDRKETTSADTGAAATGATEEGQPSAVEAKGELKTEAGEGCPGEAEPAPAAAPEAAQEGKEVVAQEGDGEIEEEEEAGKGPRRRTPRAA